MHKELQKSDTLLIVFVKQKEACIYSIATGAYYRKLKIYDNFWRIVYFYYEFKCVAQISVTSVTQFWETKKYHIVDISRYHSYSRHPKHVYFMYYDQTINFVCVYSCKYVQFTYF